MWLAMLRHDWKDAKNIPTSDGEHGEFFKNSVQILLPMVLLRGLFIIDFEPIV